MVEQVAYNREDEVNILLNIIKNIGDKKMSKVKIITENGMTFVQHQYTDILVFFNDGQMRVKNLKTKRKVEVANENQDLVSFHFNTEGLMHLQKINWISKVNNQSGYFNFWAMFDAEGNLVKSL